MSDIEELRRAVSTIAVVGAIDGHDVIRRTSVLDIIDRRRGAREAIAMPTNLDSYALQQAGEWAASKLRLYAETRQLAREQQPAVDADPQPSASDSPT